MSGENKTSPHYKDKIKNVCQEHIRSLLFFCLVKGPRSIGEDDIIICGK